MRKIFLSALACIFIVYGALSAQENQDEPKKYLSDMNRIVIEVEEAVRNVGLKILPPRNASEQIAASIEKFKVLAPPKLFSEDHNALLSAFEYLRDGLKLFSENQNEKASELVRKGGAVFQTAARSIKATAEREGLIPAKPKEHELVKPELVKNGTEPEK